MRAPPLHIVPGRVLEFQHGKRRIARVNSDGMVALENELTGEEVTVALPTLVQMQLQGLAKDSERLRFRDPDEDKFIPRYKPDATPEAKAEHARRQQTVARRIAYVNALFAELHIGPKHPAFVACISRVAEQITDRTPPSPWTAYRWLQRYRRSGCNANVLSRQELFIRTRQPKVKSEIKAAIAKHVAHLMGKDKGATVHSVTDLALALTARDFGYVQFRDQRGTMQVALTFINAKEREAREASFASPALDGAIHSKESIT